MFGLPVGTYSYDFGKRVSFVTNQSYAHLYLQCTTVLFKYMYCYNFSHFFL